MDPIAVDPAAYRTAEQLLRHNRGTLVRGAKIRPRWIDGGPRFWYTVDSDAGRRFVIVDPVAGTRRLAFDHMRLAAALAAASGHDVDAAALPFAAFEPIGGAIRFTAFGEYYRCDLDGYACERVQDPPMPGMFEIMAPDGKHAVYRDGPDLRVRSLADDTVRVSTEDGSADCEYGVNPDYVRFSSTLRRFGVPDLPPAAVWSPDSTRVLTHRTDQRDVRTTHLVQALPPDGGAPRLLTYRFAFPGDERMPLAEFVVLDTATGEVVHAAAEPVAMPIISPLARRWAWWAEDGSAVYYLGATRDGKTLRLHRFDPASGVVRTVLGESGATRVDPVQFPMEPPLVEVLEATGEVLWYSQRDGWGHLYLHGLDDGEPRVQLTSGQWAVRQILHVDQRRRTVYFVASGLVAEDPYRRTVCRVGLDGTGFARVTDDDLDHVVTVAPDRSCFLDSASTNEIPPVSTVRGWDGSVLVELERADISSLVRTGWRPPERFRATAADGTTEIHGMLYRPHGFDPAKKYPVLNHPYFFPTAHRVTPSFDPGHYGYDAEALAALGFVVVAVDGRGSPGRDKAFHDASYGRFADAVGLADHVAALRELAATRPWMDMDRVGSFGMSAGGFATVRAMLDYPELFKVGVAECGMHDLRYVDLGLAETYNGPFDAQTYAAASTVDMADRLTGRLLLVHGGLDDSVSPHLTLRLADRLAQADKDFELLILPGADHSFLGYEHHLNRRRWDFLVRHLMGARPPDVRLTPVQMDPDTLAELFG